MYIGANIDTMYIYSFLIFSCTCNIPFFSPSDKQNQSPSLTVASIQHDSWATLGFLRGVVSPPHSRTVFCTPQWIQLLLSVIEAALPSIKRQKPSPHTLVQQVSGLKSGGECM